MRTTYLLPLTILSLVLAVGALGYRARRRRGYGPFVMGLGAAAGLVAGKFVMEWDAAVHGSMAALIAASLWNSWPKRSVPVAPPETLLQLGSIQRRDEDGV